PASAAEGMPVEARNDVSLLVSGYPMIYAGMNASVERNQILSLVVSGVLVLLVLALFFRSILMAAVALVPALVTLVITFAIMGVVRIPMDVGTSMISAIALGVGIDYAVHLLWRHGIPTREQAAQRLEDALGATGWG